jgi:DNA processing protein
VTACATCLLRPWLLARLAGHLDRVRDRTLALLELGDGELVAAVGGARRQELERELDEFDPASARQAAATAGVELICRCSDQYPVALRELAAPPAVLHIAGGCERLADLSERSPVAIVGARRASPYGLAVARSLGRSLTAAGIAVVSGMALGIDAAAHQGALAGGGETIAVLPGTPEIPYPASARALHRRIVATGVAVSELPPGTRPRRWMFPARNRIIAGLSSMTVVVEARQASGALITAGSAAEIGRPVGAVPGQITSPLTAGPHELLRSGATLIGGVQDVLDAAFGVGVHTAAGVSPAPLAPNLEGLLEALGEGHDAPTALAQSGLDADAGLAALASLELAGRIRREAGGRFVVLP